MDAKTEELRAAHDVLAEFYAGRLAGGGARASRPAGLGVEFDLYWLAPEDMERQVTGAGFRTVCWGGRPPEGEEGSPQGYLIARRS